MFYLILFSQRVQVCFGSGRVERKNFVPATCCFTCLLHKMGSPFYNLNIKYCFLQQSNMVCGTSWYGHYSSA